MKLATVALGVLVLAACSGGDNTDERVLHLRTGDYTEARLRAEIRVRGLQYCAAAKGLDAQDVADIIDVQFENQAKTPGAPERPVVQTPAAEDDLRQAEILLEECERID